MVHSEKPKLHQVLLKWFIIGCVLCSALSFGVYLLISHQSITRLAYLNLTNIRDQQQFFVEHWLAERTEDVRHLSLLPAIQHQELDSTRALFVSYVEQQDGCFEALALVDNTGMILAEISYNDAAAIAADTAVDTLAALKENELYQSDRQGTPLNGERKTAPAALKAAGMLVANPIYLENGELTGAVIAKLSMSALDKVAFAFPSEKIGEVFLFDAQGTVLTQYITNQPLNEGKSTATRNIARFNVNQAVINRIAASPTGVLEYTNFRGVKVMAAYAWVPECNWGYVAEIGKAQIMGGWQGKNSSILLSFFLMVLLIIYPVSRRFADMAVNPLNKIAHKVSIFAENYKSDILSWSVLDHSYYEEIDVLNQSFYLMGEKISQLMERLEEQAQFDSLTGLANRNYYFRRSEQILDLIQRNKRVCSLIFLDIDMFKRINDTYGHSVGDEVLSQLGQIIAKNIRISDAAGRLGGEEFSIILPDTDSEGAKLLAERLRQLIEQSMLMIGENNLNITVSMGIATYHGTGMKTEIVDVLEDLIKKADQAMYLAKQKGRNRVILAEELVASGSGNDS